MMDPSRLLELCPSLVSHHDATGVFLFASSSSSSILGLSPADLVGVPLWEIACEEDQAALSKSFATFMREGSPKTLRFRVSRGQTQVSMEMRSRVVEADDGKKTAICVTHEVDEAPAEASAKAETSPPWKAHWEALVKLVPGIVWYAPIHPDGTRGKAQFISDYLERVTGYTPYEWLHTPNFWPSIIHPEDLEMTLKDTARAMAEGTPGPVYRVYTRDRKLIYFQSYLYVLRDVLGKPEQLYGLTLDVTGFKETEAQNAALLVDVQHAADERAILIQELEAAAEQILSLSAPVIPINKQAIVLPLIGPLNASRMEVVLQNILQSVESLRARVVILDLTSVPCLDEAGAAGIVRAARAARLLGASMVLTGMRADVSRAMVLLGMSLEDIPTRPTLLRALQELR